jgi:DNA invertase Pin-like site-specific DNA recombinase
MRAALYARCSTFDQSADVQIGDLVGYAKRRGFEIYKVYVDRGVSGHKDSRPALDKLMVDAKKRLFDCVLVHRFDRFARSTRHLINALSEFQSLNIDFISYSESIDTTAPLGRMVFTVVSAIAEFERDLIRERVKAGVQKARQKGKRLGRSPVCVDINKLAKLRSEGLSMRQIAQRLGISKAKVVGLIKSMKRS